MTKPWAASIKLAVESKSMPPWFADPRYGKFSNDPSLTPQQIATDLAIGWMAVHLPVRRKTHRRRSIGQRDGTSRSPTRSCRCPCPSPFPRTATWSTPTRSCPPDSPRTSGCRFTQIRPSSPQYVHHAVVYVRPPNSTWLRACSRRRAVHGVELHRSQAARRSARNHHRHAAGVCARQRARPLA